MHKTEHFKERAGQRGVTMEMVNLALEYGEIDGDRYVLSDSVIHEAIADLKAMQKRLEHAKRKGGVTVVVNGETLITTYRTNSFRRNAANKVRC